MSDALFEYEKLKSGFVGDNDIEAGQMFGKACMKVNGKAFLAQHLDTIVFKLDESDRNKALLIAGARLWDPSGKGRPMKEWVALPIAAKSRFAKLAFGAKSYVQSTLQGG